MAQIAMAQIDCCCGYCCCSRIHSSPTEYVHAAVMRSEP